jgi:hypothetical protein
MSAYHTSSTSRLVTLFPVRAPGGRVIGCVVQEGGERVFLRRVRPERHLFRALDAWPLGAYALDQLRRWRVTRLRYVGPDGVYEVPVDGFLSRAISLEFPHETQLVLPRAWWPTRPADDEGSPARNPVQGTLFGEFGAEAPEPSCRPTKCAICEDVPTGYRPCPVTQGGGEPRGERVSAIPLKTRCADPQRPESGR